MSVPRIQNVSPEDRFSIDFTSFKSPKELTNHDPRLRNGNDGW